jgi:glucose-1-phosphate adenylyltransferase
MAGQRVLCVVLAGGGGQRLAPLTADRAKPAVPFGGLYRVVDFALSNLVNAGWRRICVLTQYKSHSLDRHLSTAWRLNTVLGDYVTPVPAQQRVGPHWQAGSADAIFQSLNLIDDERPDVVAVFGADHVYRMDPRQMLAAHRAWGAGVTVAGVPVPRAPAPRPGAGGFGVARTGPDGHRIVSFREKAADPAGRPGEAPGAAYVSMGNYLFDRDFLVDALGKDAANDGSGHSMGGDIIPMLVRDGAAHVYDFLGNQVPGAAGRDAGYWQDLGTLDAYFGAHLDLCAADPPFHLDNDRWPILTQVEPLPPAKLARDDAGQPGQAIGSLVSNGVIIAGGLVRDSVLSPGVRVAGSAQVDQAVLLHNTQVGRGAMVRRAILDKNVVVPDGAAVGMDKEHDRARGFAVSDGGITVVGKGQPVGPLARRAEYWPRRGASTTQPGGTVPPRPPLPPFTEETARQKVQAAEDAWNTRDPERVAAAYTVDSVWRNRDEFITGRAEIIEFLRRKWSRELDYALRKDLWAVLGDRIAVRFQYESHDASGHWFRSYGNELWDFDADGLMRRREASINDVPIDPADRRIFGPRGETERGQSPPLQ